MAKQDSHSLRMWVCIDCFFVIANGEYPDVPVISKRYEEITRGMCVPGYVWVMDGPRDGEAESAATNEFSWAKCDCCQSNLGGSRHRAALIGG